VCTAPDSPRARAAAELAEVVASVTGDAVSVETDLRAALDAGQRAGGNTGVIVTGSLYTAGQARGLLREP
jgi:folylpolyglutamate synthase/dihydropteroate synthase